MDAVRREEMRDEPRAVRAAKGSRRKPLKGMFWGIRKDHAAWNKDQINTMYCLQRSKLKSACAWRLKEAPRACYTAGVTSNCPERPQAELTSRISWALRSRLEPFKKLASILNERLTGVIRGMLDGRSNAYVEAMIGMLQQVKRAARGFRTAGYWSACRRSAGSSAGKGARARTNDRRIGGHGCRTAGHGPTFAAAHAEQQCAPER